MSDIFIRRLSYKISPKTRALLLCWVPEEKTLTRKKPYLQGRCHKEKRKKEVSCIKDLNIIAAAQQTTHNTGKIKFLPRKKQNQNSDTYLAFGWLRAIFFSSISLSQVMMFIPAFAAYFIWEACLQGFVYIMFSGEMPRPCTNAISDWKTGTYNRFQQSRVYLYQVFIMCTPVL